MKYAYLGDRESVDLYGVHFPVGVFVEVTNETLLRKLAGNNHFAAGIVEQSIDDAPVEKAASIPAIPPAKRGRKAK